MSLIATAMNRAELTTLLADIAELVLRGECKTGFIEFGEGVDVDNPDSTKDILVKAIFITPQGRKEIGNPEPLI